MNKIKVYKNYTILKLYHKVIKLEVNIFKIKFLNYRYQKMLMNQKDLDIILQINVIYYKVSIHHKDII